MKKAIIPVLMTLLFLVNMSSGVAMSRNNQLNPRSLTSSGNDEPNKSSGLLEETLTRVQSENKSETSEKVRIGHQIRSELEQVQHQAKFFFTEIKDSIESISASIGCRFGITSCLQEDKKKTTTPDTDSTSTSIIAESEKSPAVVPGSTSESITGKSTDITTNVGNSDQQPTDKRSKKVSEGTTDKSTMMGSLPTTVIDISIPNKVIGGNSTFPETAADGNLTGEKSKLVPL